MTSRGMQESHHGRETNHDNQSMSPFIVSEHQFKNDALPVQDLQIKPEK